jgi:hypothetical protein
MPLNRLTIEMGWQHKRREHLASDALGADIEAYMRHLPEASLLAGAFH